MRARLVVIALALAAVGFAYASSRDDARSGKAASGAEIAAPANAVRLPFVYSPEKKDLVPPLVERFNAERVRMGARQIVVEAENRSSGEAHDLIARGRLKPVIW